jgi:hypothetical protein
LTDFGRERERAIIGVLGPEHFYDFENERPPARRPPLPDPTSADNQRAT